MSTLNIIILNEANFKKEVVESPIPVLVDFWAEWCGPCKMVAPILDELASEYDGKVKIGKVNVDENQGLATEHGIRAIPTLLLFKDGQVEETIVGVRPKRDFKTKLATGTLLAIDNPPRLHRVWLAFLDGNVQHSSPAVS